VFLVLDQEAEQVTVGVLDDPLAVNPNVVEAFGASVPFHAALRTVMFDPLAVWVPLHRLVTVTPLPAFQLADQPPMLEVLLLRMVTSAWNPPFHEPTVW
jgi:hypothetical protein